VQVPVIPAPDEHEVVGQPSPKRQRPDPATDGAVEYPVDPETLLNRPGVVANVKDRLGELVDMEAVV